MTVPSTTNKVTYAGDNSETVFTYTFRIFDDSDLDVTLIDNTGVRTAQVLDTDYTVQEADNPAGGTITMTVAPDSDEFLEIERNIPHKQLTDLRNTGTFTPQTHEDQFDKIVMMILWLATRAGTIDRTYTTATLPAASSDYDGWFVKVRDATGPTIIKTCLEGATADTWAWKDVASGNPW